MLRASVTVHGKQVRVSSLNVLDEETAVALDRLVSDPEELDRRCRKALLDPSRSEGDEPTGLYVRHHLEQIPGLIDAPAGPTPSVIETFVGAMRVRSIWTSGSARDARLHMDYSIDPERTQYVLTVALDRDGIIRSIEMES